MGDGTRACSEPETGQGWVTGQGLVQSLIWGPEMGQGTGAGTAGIYRSLALELSSLTCS